MEGVYSKGFKVMRCLQWTGFKWLTTGLNGGTYRTRQWTSGLHRLYNDAASTGGVMQRRMIRVYDHIRLTWEVQEDSTAVSWQVLTGHSPGDWIKLWKTLVVSVSWPRFELWTSGIKVTCCHWSQFSRFWGFVTRAKWADELSNWQLLRKDSALLS
jgi:hypothetical protein